MNRIQFIKAKIHTIQNSVKLRWLIAGSFLAIPLSVFLFLLLDPIIGYDLEGHDPNLQSILLDLLVFFVGIVYNQFCIILSTALFFSLFITHAKMPVRKYLLLLACYAYPALILGFFFGFDPQKIGMYFLTDFEVLFALWEKFIQILQGLFLH